VGPAFSAYRGEVEIAVSIAAATATFFKLCKAILHTRRTRNVCTPMLWPPCCADARRIAARALLVLALLQCLPSPRSRCACAFRYSLGCRCIVRRVAHACTLLIVRTAWGELAASKLG